MSKPVTQSDLGHILLSGMVAQTVEMATLGHLCDRIKVAQQSDLELRTIKQTVKHLYGKRGIAEIYKGIGWNITAGILKGNERWVGYTGFYELFKKTLPQKIQEKHPLFVSGCVGVSSAFAIATLNCPIENLKIREMTGNTSLLPTIRKEGVRFFFRGWGQMVVKQGCSLSSFLISFEKFKQIVEGYNGQQPVPFYQKMGVSASAAMVSCALHTPIDMLKTQAQKENRSDDKVIPTARAIFRQYGMPGFYQGFPIKLTRSVWHAFVTIWLMEQMNALPHQMKIN